MILLGRQIGMVITFLVIGSTGFIGLFLAKKQGFLTIAKFRASLAKGQVPAKEVIEELLIFTGAIFLLAPGLITDTIGFTLLLPWTRKIYLRWMNASFLCWLKNRQVKIYD